jgi:hypothetical protein
MRRHLELGLTLAAITLALGGAACSRASDRNVNSPQPQPVPVSYSEANTTSTAGPATPKAGVGYDSMQSNEGAPLPSSSTKMDNGGYDQSGVPNTGSMDNVPSGIGGGPADGSGGKSFKPGAANDDNVDDSLSPDKGKDKTDDAKPQGTPKPNSGATGKPSTGKGGTAPTGGSGSTGGTGSTGGSTGGAAGGGK